MKVVVDTNILISAFGWPGNPRSIINLAIDGRVDLLVSPDIIEEFKGVALRAKFDFSTEEIAEFIESLLEMGELVIPCEKINAIMSDPDDNIILECAVEANADIIVTGDRHLLDLKTFRGIRIMTAQQFLNFIKDYESEKGK